VRQPPRTTPLNLLRAPARMGSRREGASQKAPTLGVDERNSRAPLPNAPRARHHRAMLVRRATRHDATAIEALYRQLVPGDDNIRIAPDHVAKLEHDPTNHLLVGEVEGVVAGSAFVTICLDPMYGFQPYGVVENVIVAPDQRGQGGGFALMNAVEEIARAAHCTKLMLLSTRHRHEAHAFFIRAGFDGERKRGFVKYLNR
jgi:N-acetylglutamate synthase-like GNAT family acetyltransferase